MMAQIQNYIAEADADSSPVPPGELEVHGRCRYGVLLSPCFGALFVADLIVSGHVRPRQGTEICNFGALSPLEALHWIFCFFSSIYVQFSKTSPLKSGESSEKSSGENCVKSCHVCGCHGFFGPDCGDGGVRVTLQMQRQIYFPKKLEEQPSPLGWYGGCP